MKKRLTVILTVLMMTAITAPACVGRISHDALNGIPATERTQERMQDKIGMDTDRDPNEAAGLAISEKFRGQLRGEDAASTCAQDGIGMVEGDADGETERLLDEMKKIALKAAESGADAAEELVEYERELERIREEQNAGSKNDRVIVD